MNKPTLFIGSARESIAIVDALALGLRDCAQITRWDVGGAFRVGEFSLESLLNQVEMSDFAVFVLGQDDRTESRGESLPSPRDNVIFEAGLFTSALGRSRTFFVVDSRGTKRPSDWDGLGYLTYFTDRDDGRQIAFEATQKIRERIKERGKKTADKPAIHGSWWQMVLNTDDGSILSHMEIDATDMNAVKVNGASWSNNGKSHSTYRSRAASYVVADQLFCYSWEGEHPREGGLPKYFGIGEICFDLRSKETPSGQGYFSSTDMAGTKTALKQAIYFPASADDLAVLRDSDAKKRLSLTRKLLAKRRVMLE